MGLSRRRLLGAALAGAAGGAVVPAVAEGATWRPPGPVRLVIPFAPGGATDAVGRTVASALGAVWGSPVVVDNRAGAGTTIGTAQVARAEPDGLTLLLAPVPLAIAHFLYSGLPYDPARDLVPVALLARSPMMLACGPKSGIRDFAGLRAMGSATCGTSGNGSLAHLLLELTNRRSGLAVTHVPYRGAGPAMAAMLGGEVDLVWGTPSELAPALQSGAVGLGVAAPDGHPLAPGVPSFAALGLPDIAGEAWFGIVAPAGISPDILKGLASASSRALASPEMRRVLESQGMLTDGSGPEGFRRFLATENSRWGGVVREARLRLD